MQHFRELRFFSVVDPVVVVEGCFVEIQDNLPLPEYAKKRRIRVVDYRLLWQPTCL